MKRFVAAVGVALLLSACGSGPSLETGKVIEKKYDDEDQWYQPGHTISGSQTCTGGYNGQPQTCTRSPDIHIPGTWHTDPERFLLKLEGEHPEDSSKTITDTISVPEEFFNRVRVGQWVDVDSLEIIPR